MEKECVEGSEGELLLDNVCEILDKENKKEAVLGLCGVERKEACGADLLAKKKCGDGGTTLWGR